MSDIGWVTKAPCAGDTRFTLDDATVDSLRTHQMRRLLRVCQQCPFRAPCIALVLPRVSRFDGICGGRLWVDGVIRGACEGAHPGELVEGPAPIVHGTEAGARTHNRRGETACSLCREAGRRAQADRRARKRDSGP